VTRARTTLFAAAVGPLSVGCAVVHTDAPDRRGDLARNGEPLAWVGDTVVRVGDDARSLLGVVLVEGEALTIETQTWPPRAGTEVLVFFEADGGPTEALPMQLEGQLGNNELWRLTVPAEDLSGFRGRFWIRAEGLPGQYVWHSAPPTDFPISVLPAAEPGVWVDLSGTSCWRDEGPGRWDLGASGDFYAKPGGGLGLRWCRVPMPGAFELAFEYGHFDHPATDPSAVQRDGRYPLYHNSGVHLGFPSPDEFPHYADPTWVAIDYGEEVQIDDRGHDADGPDGEPWHSTGAVYERDAQAYVRPAYAEHGVWRTMEIVVTATEVRTSVDGVRVTTWDRLAAPAEHRVDSVHGEIEIGAVSTPDDPRYIGFQAHDHTVGFRNIRFRAL
jgi:hypothetical protein